MSEPSSLSKLRQITKSIAGAIPTPYSEAIEDKFARILSGIASQMYTRDPKTGELYLKGIQTLKDDWNNVPADQRKGGKPGIINETLSLPALAAIIPGGEKHVPEWALDAAQDADDTHKAVREEMGLPEAKGFAQNAAEASGVMLGQLPIPLARLRALRSAAPAVSRVSKIAQKTLGSAPEWFSPTVDPSIANYLSGAGFGGALGSLSDYLSSEPTEESHTSPGYAEGGKISALRKAVQGLSFDQHAKIGLRAPVNDPLHQLRMAAASVMSPEETAHFGDWIDTRKDLPALSEEDVDRLIALHDRIMKPVSSQE